MRLAGRMAGRSILLVLLLLPCAAPAITRYVDLYCPTPASPFTNWTTAATDIQSAINVSSAGDLILVSNGVYATGGAVVNGTLTNRVAITNAITVRSVNGPTNTSIVGGSGGEIPYNGLRCAYVGSNAQLIGFTLTNGHTHSLMEDSDQTRGGGAYCVSNAVISNCVIVGCSADVNVGGGVWGGIARDSIIAGNSAAYSGGGACQSVLERCNVFGNRTGWMGSGGGGFRSTATYCIFSNNWASIGGAAYECTIANSVIASNTADQGGSLRLCDVRNSLIVQNHGQLYAGAAHGSTLRNCTIVSNSVQESYVNASGGAQDCTLVNCILYGNTTAGSPNNYYGGTVNHCLVGVDPLFAGSDDFHLLVSSPGINAGVNESWMTSASDLDGVARILGGTVDIGCYEQARQASILPPAVTNPLPVQVGGFGMVRTTNTLLLVEGVKPTGVWVLVRSSSGGYVTNGIVQNAAGSNWSHQLAWNWSSDPDAKAFPYCCTTNGVATPVGLTGTTLRITSAGFGAPSLTLDDLPAISSLDPGNLPLGGMKGPHVIDWMWISNRTSSAALWFAAPEFPVSVWSSCPPVLVEGTNLLVVCGTNLFGDVACVTATVYCVPRCDLVTVSGTTRTIFGGIPTNKVYRWQMSSDMQPTNWIDCSGVFTAETASVVLTDNGVTNSRRFYRIVEVGP